MIFVLQIALVFGLNAVCALSRPKLFAPPTARYNTEDCRNVCEDLPIDDEEPVCMMFSRYKKGYQYFVNLCHARRVICKENLLLHLVHPNRCSKMNQFFMPVS